MATLYKHGEVVADYYRVMSAPYPDPRYGRYFRLMSDGTVLTRVARPRTRWKVLDRNKPGLGYISHMITEELYNYVEKIY